MAAVCQQNKLTKKESLQTVAQSAAAAGDMATVQKCLTDLQDEPSHDEVAKLCAIQLGNAGYQSNARKVARLVLDEEKRKEAIALYP